MLSELLATTQQTISQAAHAAKSFELEDLTMPDHRRMLQETEGTLTLPEGATAQWMAGFMYAYTG